jgi:hypothetical protein
MATVIFFLALAVLVFGTFAILAFCEVAFAAAARGPSPVTAEDLPLLSGNALRQWAADRARQLVAAFAGEPGTSTAALGREVENFTRRVLITVTGRNGDSARCNRQAYRSIPVTAPESAAIAETLRNRLSKRQLRRVHDVAAQNVKRLQFGAPTQKSAEPLVCPLLNKHGVCTSHETRPLFCLTHCGCADSVGCGTISGPAPSEPPFSAMLGEGIAQGLVAGLKDAGLNSSLYELNSALADALDGTR